MNRRLAAAWLWTSRGEELEEERTGGFSRGALLSVKYFSA
jgi:hypothetical protein